MDKNLEILISIDNLETYMDDLNDQKYIDKIQELGMTIDTKALASLEKTRSDLLDELTPNLKREYLRLKKYYQNSPIPRAIVPIRFERGEGFCFGCSSKIPAEVFQRVKKYHTIERCENCGRFIFWPPLP
ncbi:MAG: hypothetical protein APR63_01190 [Desulfuromonas sp. SDB]|nr:MAG: hypothetical protein APR63_01190 [Desulfuromonas sp. SDB]